MKFFRCHQLGHYASQCPEKNKGKAKSLLYWIGSFNFNRLKGGKEFTHDRCQKHGTCRGTKGAIIPAITIKPVRTAAQILACRVMRK